MVHRGGHPAGTSRRRLAGTAVTPPPNCYLFIYDSIHRNRNVVFGFEYARRCRPACDAYGRYHRRLSRVRCVRLGQPEHPSFVCTAEPARRERGPSAGKAYSVSFASNIRRTPTRSVVATADTPSPDKAGVRTNAQTRRLSPLYWSIQKYSDACDIDLLVAVPRHTSGSIPFMKTSFLLVTSGALWKITFSPFRIHVAT